MKLKRKKCALNQSQIKYLGFLINGEGLHNLPEVISAIQDAPSPTDVDQLRSFLGFINQYSKFIPHCATILSPLSSLLQKGVKWEWNTKCQSAFDSIKRAFFSSGVLVHYDPKLPLKLICDASPYGVGAALFHVFPSGEERPITFASRTLTTAEKGYAQFDREALAIVYGVKKFHHYLYGQDFLLETDHKALTWIFGSKKGIPINAAARIQRWALFLSGYRYKISHIKGEFNVVADSLSRLPMPSSECSAIENDITVQNLVINQLDTLPILPGQLVYETVHDKELQSVLGYTRHGWPKNTPIRVNSILCAAR